jgi:hypothetical protein
MKHISWGRQRHSKVQSQRPPDAGSSSACPGGDITLSSEWHSVPIEADVLATVRSIVGTAGHVGAPFKVVEEVRDSRRFEAMLAVVKTFL